MAKAKKNDNLAVYRERMQERNRALVERAIEHIRRLNGEINFSLVSKVTYDIADAAKGEKGISLAGISKNRLYRSMIEKAKLADGIKGKDKNVGVKSGVSVGDLQMSFHALRVENARLKNEKKILERQLKEMDRPVRELENIDANLLKRYEEMRRICSSIVSRLLELELAYIDGEKETLNVAIYDEVIVQKQTLELFFGKELDAIKSKIR